MGKLWDETQQNFERLGDTATHTDLANLAADYPQLLAHAAQLDQVPHWLVHTADRLALAGFWNAFNITEDAITGNTPGAAFARGAHGLWLHRNDTLENAQAHLAIAARNPLLPQNARDFLALHNARVLQLFAGSDIALPAFKNLATQKASIGIQAQFWIANAVLLHADSKKCLETMPTPDGLPDIAGDYWLNVGGVYSQCAQTDKAIAARMKTVAHARNICSPMAEGEALSYLARAEAWAHPEAAKTHAEEALRLTRKTGNLIDEQRAYLALAIAAAGTDPDEEIQATLQKAESLAYETGNKTRPLSCLVAHTWHAAVTNNNEALERCIEEINRLVASLNSGRHWADIARAWLPGQTREHAQLAARWEWLDGPDNTMRRWRELLDNRKALAA